jgi:hypothetical protein
MREGTLCHEEEGSEGDEPEPANSEPPSQPPDVGRDCSSNLEEDCCPAYPPASEDGAEQREDGSVPPQAQEGRAILPRMSNDESDNEHRKRRGPSNTAIATGGTASQPQARCCRRRDIDDGEDYRPGAHSDAERSEDDGVVQSPRRKRSKASDTTVPTASQRQTRPHHGDSSRTARTISELPRRQPGAAHPPSSQESTLRRDTETDRTPAAKFEGWPLRDASLNRVTMNGSRSIFSIQFTWEGPCAEHGAGYRETENRDTVPSVKRHCPARRKRKGPTKDEDKPTSISRRARYTPAEDAEILRLKREGLSVIQIAKHFPMRSAGAIGVRYHKLKTADPSQPRSRQLRDHSRALSPVVGDDGKEEFEVEEICDDRRLYNRGPELLVKWKGGEETWEPYENVAETEALEVYERRHGRVEEDIV